MNSLILVNKPKNISSFQVCNRIKHHFKLKKTGHSGTLDPLASGLLVVAVNKATKILRFLPKDEKVYELKIEWGISTDTWDMEGEVVEKSDCTVPDIDLLRKKTKELEGDTEFLVPHYSAKKRTGPHLYKYATQEE